MSFLALCAFLLIIGVWLASAWPMVRNLFGVFGLGHPAEVLGQELKPLTAVGGLQDIVRVDDPGLRVDQMSLAEDIATPVPTVGTIIITSSVPDLVLEEKPGLIATSSVPDLVLEEKPGLIATSTPVIVINNNDVYAQLSAKTAMPIDKFCKYYVGQSRIDCRSMKFANRDHVHKSEGINPIVDYCSVNCLQLYFPMVYNGW